ncbi:MAG: YraN family protein [bacterium]|nr:YraN family protein [bacterium]
MVPSHSCALGAAGEDAAAAWLAQQGYQLLARNVRTRYGEIDLVVRSGTVVVFVEVKSRTGARFGHPGEAVAATKQRRLARLASAYLLAHGLGGCATRFDVIAVRLGRDGHVFGIEHIPDAFQAGE